MITRTSVPEVGKEYDFYDDGKITSSRHYIATVKRVITPDEGKEIKFPAMLSEYGEIETYKGGDESDYCYELSLYDIWVREIENHLQSDNFTVLAKGASTKPGEPWLYSRETDYFVECSIPEYDDDTIWFSRTVGGNWFSMDIQSSWQSGELDTDKKYKLDTDD